MVHKSTKHSTLSPEGNCESCSRWGPLDSLSILYVIGERKSTISILRLKSAFLKISKTFIPRRELRKLCPMGSTWQSFHFICDWWTKFDYLNFRGWNPPFWKSQKPLSPEGNAKQSLGVQLIFLSFIVIHERKMEFQFWTGNPPKSFGQKPLLRGWMGGWVGGWMDGWVGGWMDGWVMDG